LLQKVLHKGLVENKYDIEIERRNPKSPLFSVKSFEALNLKPELLKVWTLVILIKVLHA
jgi:ATP-dependent RNA helicase DDX19/DBP5